MSYEPLRISAAMVMMAATAVVLFCAPSYSQKLRLRSQMSLNCGLSGNAAMLKFADIWADGNVAIQGTYNCRGVYIYDISNPDRPILASIYNPAPNQAFLEAIVVGNRGYFGSGGPTAAGNPSSGDGVHIVDLTNPYQPVLLGKVNSSIGNGFNGIHEMVIHGKYLIENYNSTANKALKIIDVSSPTAPVLKWELSPQDTLWVHAVHVRGNRMYTSGWNGRIEIYDISDLDGRPPQLIGTINGSAANHSSWTSEDGNYLFSCRETMDGDLRVYDVRNPAQPLLVRAIKTTDLGLNAISPHNPVVVGNLLYVSWYQAGVQVFDISDPRDPRRIAQYDTYPAAFDAELVGDQFAPETGEPWDMVCGASNLQNAIPSTYDGNWAVFPLLGADRVIAGDMAHGLLILDARGVSAPQKNRISDFDGDRKTDLAVFGQNGWLIESSQDGGAMSSWFGLGGDLPVAGDYDGDGRSDIAVFRPSNGYWYILQNSGGFYGVPFGQAGDIPVPADYDADGKTDVAVFRPSNGVWFVLRSTLGVKIDQWGQNGDKPITGDFDGDGKADLTVWRPSNGVWYVYQSSSSIPTYGYWGTAGDKPVSADFDGNGLNDFAVYRPSNGVWYIYDPQASTQFRAYYWGLPDDLPMPADFDGDGISDPAVYRPNSMQWFWINSSNAAGVGRVFGQADAQPIAAALQPR